MIPTALKNPYAAVALGLIVVILGVGSFQKMEVDIFPEINIPMVAVATFDKGMSQKEIEGGITLRVGTALPTSVLRRAYRVTFSRWHQPHQSRFSA